MARKSQSITIKAKSCCCCLYGAAVAPQKKNQNYSLNLKPTKETFSISITRISVGPLHLRFTYGDDNLKKMYLAKFFYKFSFHLAAFFELYLRWSSRIRDNRYRKESVSTEMALGGLISRTPQGGWPTHTHTHIHVWVGKSLFGA